VAEHLSAVRGVVLTEPKQISVKGMDVPMATSIIVRIHWPKGVVAIETPGGKLVALVPFDLWRDVARSLGGGPGDDA
jgi:hypothetical protein